MKGIFYFLFLFFSLCHDSYPKDHASNGTMAQPRNNEISENLAKNIKDLSGEYILERSDKLKGTAQSFPNSREYERIVIRRKNKNYEVTYFGARPYSVTGLPPESDLTLYYFFVTKAEDVEVKGSKISFVIKDRYMFRLEHAPHTLKEANTLKSNRLYLFKISSPIVMKGSVDGYTLTVHCQGVDCISDVMVFTSAN